MKFKCKSALCARLFVFACVCVCVANIISTRLAEQSNISFGISDETKGNPCNYTAPTLCSHAPRTALLPTLLPCM